MTSPEIRCFHIAIVVPELEAAMDAYRRLLGAETWRTHGPSADGIRIAYGSGSGQTWELLEASGDGGTAFHAFRDRYGQGVQHVGFWTPDIHASVRDALDRGGRLVAASRDPQGRAAVQIVPGADATPELIEQNIGIAAFIDPGLGAWCIEYIGDAGHAFLREWLEEDYDEIIVTPRPA